MDALPLGLFISYIIGNFLFLEFLSIWVNVVIQSTLFYILFFFYTWVYKDVWCVFSTFNIKKKQTLKVSSMQVELKQIQINFDSRVDTF